MQSILFKIAFSLCLLVFVSCSNNTQEQNLSESPQRDLKALTLQTENGQILTIAIQKEREFAALETQDSIWKHLNVTDAAQNLKILVFFTTWCDPCKGILPHLENLKNQFSDKIAFFGIPVDDLVGEMEDFKESIQIFNEENSFKIPLILDENRTKLFKALGGIEGVPLIAMYGENGEYIMHYLGAVPEEMIEFDLTQHLKEQ